MDRIIQRLTTLRTKLIQILQVRNDAVAKHAGIVKKADTDLKIFCERAEKELQDKQDALRVDATQKRAQAEHDWAHRAAAVRTAVNKKKFAIEKQLNDRKVDWMERRKAQQAQAVVVHKQKLIELDAQHAKNLAQLEEIAADALELKSQSYRFAYDRGVKINKDVEPEPASTEVPDDAPDVPDEKPARLEERLNALEQTLKNSQRLGPILPPLAAYALVITVHAAAWGVLTQFQLKNILELGFVVSCIVFLALVHTYITAKKQKVREAGVNMIIDAAELHSASQREKSREKNRNMSEITQLGVQRVIEDNEEGDRFNQKITEFNKPLSDALAKVQNQCDRLLQKISGRKGAALQSLETSATQAAAALRSSHDLMLSMQKEQTAAAIRSADLEENAALETLANTWKSELIAFDQFVKESHAQFAASHPPWTAANVGTTRLPDEYSKEVPIGELNLDIKALAPRCDDSGPFSLESLKAVALPMFLSFPLHGSLLVGAIGNRRAETLALVFNTVLNLLRSFPPAKAKLTIIDPIGLGQNFAGLMHLADYDETLVNGRIWSDGAHIERKLTELTEHMEKIIQKYLRNRYKTIDEYNREAGQLAEPYRFVVIGDFPTGFSELALERLASIIKSGVRCGVYTLILHNEKMKLPPQIEMPLLRQNGFIIRERGEGFVVDDETLNMVRFRTDEGPNSAQIDQLVNSIGKQCREAARVQVPFEVVMPKPEQYWTSNTEASIRIPLGKAGADRLQYLEVGRGTAQHALIAGKTGSGKSNLFHVIVTNAASWYSPRELEFYLIDFKKGVEFKTYGTHRLRHARVVAIESDREFAISVLRRIDGELTARGELFRKARVQDFASFRKVAPEQQIPRTLLMIDEFQEFFVDDDSVAQEAALLLDRIVRQGRAFGIHVILGSQTLGGTYTLSKSTLGQVGVRIALACNEADSYLILSDDNSAASLLSRPGEAIYNDMAGLVEGNNPFQAVWLPKDLQDNYLEILQRKAVEVGVESKEPIVVFEGSSLADLRNNMLLRTAALNEPRPENAAPHIWMGEPNAIKGPTEVEFTRQAGANLLVIGHRGDTEIAMCCASILSLAAAHAPSDFAIKILDGTRADAPARERLLLLAKSLPYDIEIADYRRGTELIVDLAAQMKQRQEPGAPIGKHTFFMVLGLEKFRMLRQEDEYAFSSRDDSAGPSASKGFTDLLTEGPNAGIHTLLWCDTLSNLNRALSRKTLREFEMRVLFQLSQSDSSELIDSPAANRLGMYNALLYSAQSGQIEKFRPYAAPDKDLIAEFGNMLSARAARKARVGA